MIKKIPFYLVFYALAFTSCSHDDFKKADSGLEYKFVTKNNGKKPSAGDILTLDMNYSDEKDSVLFRSSVINKDSFRMALSATAFPGDLTEGLKMMSPGDSAAFRISSDSLFEKTFATKIPSFIRKGSYITFHVRLKNFITKEQYEKELHREKAQSVIEEDESIRRFVINSKYTIDPTASGLYFIETKKGTGKKPQPGNVVRVLYTGKFFDGKIFDSSTHKENPFSFRLGEGEVIKGWDEGIGMMSVDSKATLIMPSRLAYGSKGSGPIPPNTPLVFEVELLDVNN